MTEAKPASRSIQSWTTLLLNASLVLLTLYHIAITVSCYLANQFFTHDVGHTDYWFYNTYHGRFFWSIVCDCPHFAKHFTPTLVLLVPFHALFHHPLFIPIAEDIAALSGAWAVAWMANAFLRKPGATFPSWPFGLALGLLYAANPYTGAILLSHHFESFALALMLWSIAALANGKRRLFLLLMLLSIGVKEDLALYWAAFGAWWVVFGWESSDSCAQAAKPNPSWKKRLILGALLVVLCAIWSAVALCTIRHLAVEYNQPLSHYSERYDWMGKTMGARLRTVFVDHPIILAALPWKVAYLLLPATLLLPLFAPSALLLLLPPTFLICLTTFEPQNNLYYYYSYPFIPFLMLGSAQGLARIIRFLQTRRRPERLLAQLFAALVLAGFCMLSLKTPMEQKRRGLAHPTNRHAWIRETLRAKIPVDASVAAQFDLLVQIPYRTNIYPLSEANLDRAKYWVFDTQGFPGDVTPPRAQAMLKRAFALADQSKARIVVDGYGLLIIERF